MRAAGEQDGQAVDDGIAAVAGGAEDGVGLESERGVAYGADQAAKIVGGEGAGHENDLSGSDRSGDSAKGRGAFSCHVYGG